MEKSEILKQMQDIFIDVLDNDDIVLIEDTTADDIEDWDSLEHIHLVTAIEQEFKMKFTMGQVVSMKNVGEMVDIILEKVG